MTKVTDLRAKSDDQLTEDLGNLKREAFNEIRFVKGELAAVGRGHDELGHRGACTVWKSP